MEVVSVPKGIKLVQAPEQRAEVPHPKDNDVHIALGEIYPFNLMRIERVPDEKKTYSDSVHKPFAVKSRRSVLLLALIIMPAHP